MAAGRNEQSLSQLSHPNICTLAEPKKEENRKKKKVRRIRGWDFFPNLVKTINPQNQEAQ